MKATLLFLALAASVGQTAAPPGPPLPPPPATMPPAPATVTPAPGPAGDAVVPTTGYPAARYETLWTKSPFAVATAEEADAETSPDYMLVGVANIGGISFASLIERQNQEHFLVSSDQETRGLKLTSITRSHDGSDTFAVVQKDGQPLTLKLEQPPAGQPVAANAPPGTGGVAGMTPQIPMPGAGQSYPGGNSVRPFTRFHRPLIHLPPQTGQQPTPMSLPPPAAVHPTPPPPQ